jgi:hypothetical protein
MKFRQCQLLAATSIMTAGTKVIDINVKDVISRITVVVRGVNSTWDPVGHPALIAKQIDLVDGSDVLHSMRGNYSQAVAFYGTKVQPFNYINYTDNGTCVASIPLYFGRELYDPLYALDPSKFNNLQLKIEHNYALGGATPDSCTLEVWADIFDEPPAGVLGFLTAKSHWTKTLVQSTTDYVDLPTDHPIRLVMPAAQSDDEEPDINIDNVKLSEEHDKRVLFECGVLELLQMYESQYPAWIELMEGRLPANADQEFWVTPCKDIQIDPFGSQDTDSIIHVPWSGGSGRKINGSLLTTFNANVTGRSPHGVIPIPMGKLMDPATWWDTPELGSARIKMVTGAGDTSTLYELLLQQMRKY